MLMEAMKTLLAQMDTEEGSDAELMGPLVSMVAECIKNAGSGAFHPNEIPVLVNKIFVCMDASMKRTLDATEHKKKRKGRELDEDDEGDSEEEVELRKNLLEMLGALMKNEPQQFTNEVLMLAIQQKIVSWLQVQEFKGQALYLACEVVDSMKDASTPLWPHFMPAVLAGIGDKDADISVAAHYCVNVAA